MTAPSAATPPDVAEDAPVAEAMGLRDAIAAGGVRTLVILATLAVFDEFDNVVIGVFAPDIQESLGIGTGALAAIGTVAGAVYVAGAVPIARLADRSDRRRIVAVATAVFGLAVGALGLVRNLLQFVVARVVAGLGKSNGLPVHGSMLADAYPERSRGAVFAAYGSAAPLGRVLAPLSIAGLTLFFTGDEAWRTVALVLAVPVLVVALVAWRRLPEPGRGANERSRILGDAADEVPPAPPVAVDMAFARIRRIATFDRLATGIGVIGFSLFSVPIFVSLVLDDQFGLDAGQRSLVATAQAVASLAAVPIGAGYGGRLFQRDPGRLLRLMGASVVVSGLCIAAGIYMPDAVLLTIWLSVGSAITTAAFVMLFTVVSAVVPPNLRAQGFSLLGLYVFLIGGFFGAVVAGIVADSIGTRAAIPVVLLPVALVGGYLIGRAGETIAGDMDRVTRDVLEEAEEHRRRREEGDGPVLQVRDLHVSIGQVQVLHGIDLEVWDQEIVALVGTNGAGKSTLLRAVSGLVVAERGVIRFGPVDVTLQAAHQRSRVGIVQLSGGRSSFGPLTVRENFDVGAIEVPPDERAARVEHSLELFPELVPLLDQRADRLSGGEQQMLGLARTLLLAPELLLVDELSLGLAPVVVGRLVETLDEIRRAGTSIVIVEQSLNIAAAAADRVVFLDRGRVTFEGGGAELLARRDIARSVFLGGDG